MKKIKYEEFFYALSDKNRLKILTIINDLNEVCGCEILKKLNITQPTFVYHMNILKEANLITCKKQGIWCIYKINNKTFYMVSDYINLYRIVKEN